MEPFKGFCCLSCTVEGKITGRVKLNQPLFLQRPFRNLTKTLDLRLRRHVLSSFSSYFFCEKVIFFYFNEPKMKDGDKGDTKLAVKDNACLFVA